MMPHMIDQNWLLSYQTIEGIYPIWTDDAQKQIKMRFAEELRGYTLNLREDFTSDDLRGACETKLIEE
jgi:hypothetical protein